MSNHEPKSFAEHLNKIKSQWIEEQRLVEQMREILAWSEKYGRLPRQADAPFLPGESIAHPEDPAKPAKPFNSDYERLYIRMYECGVLARNSRLKLDRASLETLIDYLDSVKEPRPQRCKKWPGRTWRRAFDMTPENVKPYLSNVARRVCQYLKATDTL
jgi:hypothetical protein